MNHPQTFHRRSIRLPSFDYSQSGIYFVTLCAYQRGYLFGEIINAEMQLNERGKIIEEEWLLSERLRKEIHLDNFVIMPNHFHALIEIQTPNLNSSTLSLHSPFTPGPRPKSLASLIIGFKSSTTKRACQFPNWHGAALWQRNYYEHVVRNETALQKIREYIDNNPLFWEFDNDNLNNRSDLIQKP